MIKVIHLPSPHAGTSVQTSTHTPKPTTSTHDGIGRQQAIENALSLALWHIRQDYAPGHIHQATVKAVRAASMLKQCCTEANPLPIDFLAAIQGRA